MTKVSGWDTVGATGVSALDDGRFVLKFTGTDGAERKVFIPGTSVGQLVTSLIALNAAARVKSGGKIGDPVQGSNLMGVAEVSIAAAADGNQFALGITTGDKLQLRFLLDRDTTEALASGLVASLAKHGAAIGSTFPQGTKH